MVVYDVMRNAAGWPIELPYSERSPLVQHIGQAIHHYNGTATPAQINSYLENRPELARLIPTFTRSQLWDFRFACIQRAATEAGANQAYQLPYYVARQNPAEVGMMACHHCDFLGYENVFKGWKESGELIAKGFLEAGDYDGEHYQLEEDAELFECPACKHRWAGR